jgi:hypothetical protein
VREIDRGMLDVMVEPSPRWATWLVGVILLAVLAGLVVLVVDPFGGDPAPKPARWQVDPSAALDPSASTIPILVQEIECASGRSAQGRIEVTVSYRADAVELHVGVRPLGGDLTCPGNLTTPYTVELDEPLGDRAVVGERPITG